MTSKDDTVFQYHMAVIFSIQMVYAELKPAITDLYGYLGGAVTSWEPNIDISSPFKLFIVDLLANSCLFPHLAVMEQWVFRALSLKTTVCCDAMRTWNIKVLDRMAKQWAETHCKAVHHYERPHSHCHIVSHCLLILIIVINIDYSLFK